MANDMVRTAVRLEFDGGIDRNPGGVMSIGWRVVEKNGGVLAEDGRRIAESEYPNPEHRTNNVAEFLALIGGLEWLTTEQPASSWSRVDVVGDSQFVVKCAQSPSRSSKPHLRPLIQQVQRLIGELRYAGADVICHWVRREHNQKADELGRKAEGRKVGSRAGAVCSTATLTVNDLLTSWQSGGTPIVDRYAAVQPEIIRSVVARLDVTDRQAADVVRWLTWWYQFQSNGLRWREKELLELQIAGIRQATVPPTGD